MGYMNLFLQKLELDEIGLHKVGINRLSVSFSVPVTTVKACTHTLLYYTSYMCKLTLRMFIIAHDTYIDFGFHRMNL